MLWIPSWDEIARQAVAEALKNQMLKVPAPPTKKLLPPDILSEEVISPNKTQLKENLNK